MEYTEIIYLLNSVVSEDAIGNQIVSSNTSTKCYAKKQMNSTMLQ